MGDETDNQLGFGSEPYAVALKDRIVRHFKDGGENPAFVAGIFGEWGCGKTRWLQRIDQLINAVPDTDEVVTIPVFFNAWRYEKEEHLVIPLLKTAQRAVERASEAVKAERTVGEKAVAAVKKAPAWLAKCASMLKDSAVAIACGLSAKAKIPLLAGSLESPLEVSFSPKDMVAADRENQKRREEAERSKGDTFEKYASIYYDFQEHLSKVTGRSNDSTGGKLNLVFLIDDLDRCLPEKAVEMLEAIKLFFEVPGCAFVLGLDEEIVSRGILHRYRDYAFEAKTLTPGSGPVQPITGHEYLEKMVHLPLRVPAVAKRDAREFLLKNYRQFFEKRVEAKPAVREPGEAGKPDAKGGGGQNPPADPLIQIEEDLLAVFLETVPHVPRKLVRVAELYGLHREIAKSKNLDFRPDILLRVVVLQLFAPAIYRFGRRNPNFFSFMIRWRETLGVNWMTDAELEAHLKPGAKKNGKNSPANLERYAHDHIEVPLWELIRDCARNRSGFDPRKLVRDVDKSAEFPELSAYFTFVQATESSVVSKSTVGVELGVNWDGQAAVSQSQPQADQVARISDPTGFIAQICSRDPLQWRNALAQNAETLAGRVFAPELFGEIRRRAIEGNDMVTVAWIEMLFPHLTAEQMQELYRVSNLLGRLSQTKPK